VQKKKKKPSCQYSTFVERFKDVF